MFVFSPKRDQTESRVAGLHKHVLKIPVSPHFHSHCVPSFTEWASSDASELQNLFFFSLEIGKVFIKDV